MLRWNGIRRVFRLDPVRRDVDRAVDEELQFHFATKIDALVHGGMALSAAQDEATRQFGDIGRTRDQLRRIDQSRDDEQRRQEFWGNLRQDLRQAARGLRLNPAFSLAVILTLGLGIGANATMFSIIDRIMLRPPALLREPAAVNRVYLARTRNGQVTQTSNMAYARYLDVASHTTTLEATAAFNEDDLAVGLGDATREEHIGNVSASFWSFFDMQPAMGRFFTATEDRVPVGDYVVVLGHNYWQRAYGGDRGIIGKTLHIGEHDYSIIGVAPRGFDGVDVDAVAAWIPITTYAGGELGQFSSRNTGSYATQYNWSWMEMLVRRKAGITVAAASNDMTNAYQQSYRAEGVTRPSMTPIETVRPAAFATPIQRERGPDQGDDAKVSIWLIGVATIVLIIACANVGNLQLARSQQRQRETAVRLALGISRLRLLRLVLAESVMLALSGGVLALLIAQWGGGLLRATLLPDTEWPSILTDPRMLLYTGMAALFAGVTAAIAPLLQARTTNLAGALRSGARQGTARRSRLRTSLLLLQGALSVLLLVGAGLFVRSFRQVQQLHLGYDADRLLMVSVQAHGVAFSNAEAAALRDRLLESAAALPGVEHAARNMSIPFRNTQSASIFVTGVDSSVLNHHEFDIQGVSSDYFPTTGTRILRGRAILPSDGPTAPTVMVISESMARMLWPGQDALGQCVRLRVDSAPCHQVVGVAEDIKAAALRDDPSLLYYVPIQQYAPSYGGLFVRTRGRGDLASAEAVRRSLQRDMPGTSYVTVRPFNTVIGDEARAWSLGAMMFTMFGVLALVVAAVGLYSVVAYGVVLRRQEMGLRLALGAQTSDLLSLVLGEGMRMAAISIAIGLALALIAGRWIAPLLFNTSPKDPAVLAVVCGVLALSSAGACMIPALRAARVDPNAALRE